ncbi:MAG: FAD-binding oxidoreductase [Alphaproteobacteria bacterium]|nr:FAD-binding oxidoreductase [Alphaproteobacteria bacterium]
MTDTAVRDDDGDVSARHGAWVQRRLSDVSGHLAATQLVCRPDRLSRVLAAIPAPEGRSLIARGGGQSYGDSALNDGGCIVLTDRLDRMLSFDSETGLLVAEAGVTVGDILRTFLPRGHALAVCPGSSRTTLGGAIAADVHGMNHVHAGAFGAHISWLDLVTARGGLRRISALDEPDLFDATVGGMGLTGVVVRAAICLSPLTSPLVDVDCQAMASCESLLDALVAAAEAHTYASAWIDVAAVGPKQGSGVLETADLVPPQGRAATSADRCSRREWPQRVISTATGRAFRRTSAFWRRRGRLIGPRACRLPLGQYLFEDEHPARSREGLWQRNCVRFQVVLPLEDAAGGIRRLLDIARRGGGVSSAHLRTMGKEGRGLLSFARPGMSLTLDLPPRIATPDLMRRLERETLDRGGRAFLACDAYLTDHGFAAMYPRLPVLRDVLARVDPEMRLQSDLARRLRLRDYIV